MMDPRPKFLWTVNNVAGETIEIISETSILQSIAKHVCDAMLVLLCWMV